MLPQMNDKFERFIAPARVNSGGLILAAALIVLMLFYSYGTLVAFFLYSVFNMASTGSLTDAWLMLSVSLTQPDDPRTMIMLLVTFMAMFAAPWLVVRLFRDQPLSTLIGPPPTWRPAIQGSLKAAAILAPILAVTLTIGFLLDPPTPNLALTTWLPLMLIALPLLLIQVSAEELVFRGFIMQELAVRFKSRWIWFVLPSFIFGCLHFDYDKMGANAFIVVLATTLFGIIAADVTIRTGNLGAAIGLHFVNNFFAMMIVSLDGTLTGLSLFTTNVHVSDHSTVRTFLLMDIGLIVIVYTIYLLIMRRRTTH